MAFWCTPEGRAGFKHCARRFATIAFDGTAITVLGCACKDCRKVLCQKLYVARHEEEDRL
jgi:hypothetical protein